MRRSRMVLAGLVVLALGACGGEGGSKGKGDRGAGAGASGAGMKAEGAAKAPRRGGAREAARPVEGGGGAALTYPPVVTTQDLAERGQEMLGALTRTYKPGPEQARRNFRTACRIVNQAFAAKGADPQPVRCDVIDHPAFNANTLPGGIIVATTTLVTGLTNLAAAQVLHQQSMKDYLAYNDALAAAIAKGTAPAELPLPACPDGGPGCLAAVAKSKLFRARVTGLLTAIAAHEFGHVRAGHVLNEFLRKNVEQFHSRAFKQMTGKQVDTMFQALQGAAMNHVDEDQADEMAARYLALCHAVTQERYGAELRDKLAGPHPMDAFYTLWFLMSLDEASRKAGKDTPAYQKNHPPARLRAERVLQVIIRNQLASHRLARLAHAKLFGK